MVKATYGLFFHCSTLLQPERYLLANHSLHNAFFKDLPVSSCVYYSPLLTANSNDLVVARDGFFCIIKIICILHSDYFECRGAFQSVLDLNCSIISWQRSASSPSATTGVCSTICIKFFIEATLTMKVFLKQFLTCAAV